MRKTESLVVWAAKAEAKEVGAKEAKATEDDTPRAKAAKEEDLGAKAKAKARVMAPNQRAKVFRWRIPLVHFLHRLRSPHPLHFQLVPLFQLGLPYPRLLHFPHSPHFLR